MRKIIKEITYIEMHFQLMQNKLFSYGFYLYTDIIGYTK